MKIHKPKKKLLNLNNMTLPEAIDIMQGVLDNALEGNGVPAVEVDIVKEAWQICFESEERSIPKIPPPL